MTMFIASRGFEVAVPPELLGAQHTCWRALELWQVSGWFIATLELGRGDLAGLHRLLFAWDSDVAFAVEGPMQARLVDLTFVRPPAPSVGRWQCLTIARLWRGHDAAQGNCEVLAFETEQGDMFCSSDAVPVPSTVAGLTVIAETALARKPWGTRQ